ncbi:MAG: hypothetical protein ACE362_14665 [Phaeodactylibacter xiamenensis]|uniref:Outer membrane protein beta-barrel domain-containing protein n=1 Tax=Phaeodactylibacter xiamenensis TaxID=1524460 RepID=A0A098S4Y5_9BACT|nr:hypothetical protein [Phaeodactylibacter xiamenensis]KGE86262.1 hypothetical protein IX84_22885 [Phaeodactylibacter xiamenensis]
MKKLLLLSLLSLASHALLQAQIEKGALTLRGAAGLEYLSAAEEEYSGLTYELGTRIGWMLTDHWLLGTSLGVVGIGGSGAVYFAAPEVRYYFNPGSEKNNYYGGFRYSFNSEGGDYSTYEFQLGLNRFINEQVAFDANLVYSVQPEEEHTLLLSIGLQPFINKADRAEWKSAASAFNKGDLLINPSFGSGSYRGGSFLEMMFNPDLGLFLSEQTLIGVNLNASFLTVTGSLREFNPATITELSIAPYLRHYLSKEQNHWRWYGQVGFLFAGSNFESSVSERNSSVALVSGRLGTNWFLTPNLAFDIGLDLSHHLWANMEGTSDRSGPFDEQMPDRGFQVGASIGVQYFLQRGN